MQVEIDGTQQSNYADWKYAVQNRRLGKNSHQQHADSAAYVVHARGTGPSWLSELDLPV